jgi:hypothetical protein
VRRAGTSGPPSPQRPGQSPVTTYRGSLRAISFDQRRLSRKHFATHQILARMMLGTDNA